MMCLLLAALGSPEDSEVIDLKVLVSLGAFNVLVCDRSSNLADIKIQGTDSQQHFLCSLLLKPDFPDFSFRDKWLHADARITNSFVSLSQRFHCPQCGSMQHPQEGKGPAVLSVTP